ncbi:ATP-binding protein [Halalkalibacter krulwichiae]|uniref:histidine kinase n=1 Tax=Halalkalibacter krulwichiae TaxID=199441 RepID=A0A1X9MDH5_9BACI|nr:ATP-binding protein [Halalkalibacter krulwichiae]ARK30173.1 Sporulation kinase A [Halalkalibacter krulwichiae]
MLDKYISEVTERCRKNGLDPSVIPSFQKATDEELKRIQEEYRDTLTVIRFFITKFLSKSEGIPLMVTVTDDQGTFIEYFGDKTFEETVAKQTGLQKGIKFTEDQAGVSSLLAAIELEIPVQLLGEDHYHHFLHSAACYSVPLYVHRKLIGTITVMTFLNHAHSMILTSLETVVDSIQRELDLRKENRFLDQTNQMMLEQSSIGYIVVEKNGKIVNANPKAKGLFPILLDDAKYIYDIDMFRELREKIEHGAFIRNYEMVFQNTSHIVCLVDCFPFLEGRLIQLHDITEYKKTESYIQSSEKLAIVGQLAAGVAHEIKNPLTTIKGFIQLLEEKRYNELYTPILLKEIERINQITDEFLSLSRPTLSSKGWYDIEKILSEIEVIFSSLALPKNVEFIQKIDEVSSIFCDGNQLKQVFINLFKNCVEAVGQNGLVIITVKQENPNTVLIRFEDNGDGFAEHILSNVGQPFVTTKEAGNGLGMMVCKRIIENIHMGKLHFQNNENGSAVVEILLPCSLKEL